MKNQYLINVTFQTTTPESAEIGDFENQGFKYEDLAFDSIRELIEYLEREGIQYYSSSNFDGHSWYHTESSIIDYSTGEDETLNFHLDRLPLKKQARIYRYFKNKGII